MDRHWGKSSASDLRKEQLRHLFPKAIPAPVFSSVPPIRLPQRMQTRLARLRATRRGGRGDLRRLPFPVRSVPSVGSDTPPRPWSVAAAQQGGWSDCGAAAWVLRRDQKNFSGNGEEFLQNLTDGVSPKMCETGRPN